MKTSRLLAGLFAASASLLVYGLLVESKNLKLEKRKIFLPDWPIWLDGYRVAIVGDLHLRDEWSLALAKRAIALALGSDPDIVVFAGDFIAYPKPEAYDMLKEVLLPMLLMEGQAVSCLGNHDFEEDGSCKVLPILECCGIKVLENQAWRHEGITWAGIGSATLNRDVAKLTIEDAKKLGDPILALWHEPDMVDELPTGAALMISGHSHGGQFTFPGGYTPMLTNLGRKYPRGYYPKAKTPLYVTRGVGTTGPPSRLNCSPEVSLLTIKVAY